MMFMVYVKLLTSKKPLTNVNFQAANCHVSDAVLDDENDFTAILTVNTVHHVNALTVRASILSCLRHRHRIRICHCLAIVLQM